MTGGRKAKRAPVPEGKVLAAMYGRVEDGELSRLLAKTDGVFLRVATSGDLVQGREEVMALLEAMAAADLPRRLIGAEELFQRILQKAVACAVGHRPAFDLIVTRLLPDEDQLRVSGLAYNLACASALFGEREEALRWTGKALEMGHDAAAFSASDFESLRGDDEFQRLVASTGPGTQALTEQLGEALEELDLERVKELVAAGADVNGVPRYDPILRVAIEAGRFGPHADDDDVRARRLEIVSFLIDEGANLDRWPWRVLVGDEPLLDLLLERGLPVEDELLAEAVAQENLPLLRRLVRGGVVLRERGCFFRKACQGHRSTVVLEYLAGEGVDLTDPEFILGFASAGSLAHLELLVAKGIDVNVRDADGGSLLGHAAHGNRTAVVSWAIARGAALDAVTSRGAGLVQEAIEAGATACAELLLAAGAPVDMKDRHGRTALQAAGERGLDELAERIKKARTPA